MRQFLRANMTPTAGDWDIQACFPNAAKGHTFEPSVCIISNHPDLGKIRIADIPDVKDIDSEEMANAILMSRAKEMRVECLKLYGLLETAKRMYDTNNMTPYEQYTPFWNEVAAALKQ